MIKNEQSFVFDPYAKPDNDEMMKALKLFRNLYYAERSISSLLLDGYYRNTAEYNSELIDNMGLIEEEVVNLKEYQKEMRDNIQSAYDSIDQTHLFHEKSGLNNRRL